MSTIGCNDFLHHLDAWLEGQQDANAREHLRDCPHCRGLVEDLGAIQSTAQTMVADEFELEPSARVWTALRSQLQEEGLIRTQRRSWAAGAIGWLEGLALGARGPVLAGADMAVLIAARFRSSVAPSIPTNQRQQLGAQHREFHHSPQCPARYRRARHRLLYPRRCQLDAVTASLHQSLAIVDNDIALCEKSVREDP